MDPSFFKSFWNLLDAQVGSEGLNEKVAKDVFSSTFLRAMDFASDAEKRDFVAKLKIAQTLDPLVDVAKSVLANWMDRDPIELLVACRTFSTELLAGPLSGVLEKFNSSTVNRVLSSFFPVEAITELVTRVDLDLVPSLVGEADKLSLLASFPALVADISALMNQAVVDLAEWLRTESKRQSDLEFLLVTLANTRRLTGLFRQLPNAGALKEQFLVCVGLALRACNSPETVEETQKIFFFVPSIGVVMDRWLDKTVASYNADVIARVRAYLGSGGQAHLEEFRAVLRPAFHQTDVCTAIQLPFGGDIDKLIGDFALKAMNADGKFRILPAAMTAETVAALLALYPTYVQLENGGRARLTTAGLRTSVVWKGASEVGKSVVNEVEPAASLAARLAATEVSDKVAPAGLESEVAPTRSALANPTPAGPPDLVDILLKELVQRLPQHAFLHRPAPSKVRPGVYRFGAREVTFHTKSGVLLVYRVGEHISESDAVEFLAREFDVRVDKLTGVVRIEGLPGAAASGISRDRSRSPRTVERIPMGPTGSGPADHPNFKTRMCTMHQAGRCNRGATCGYAHGESDLRKGGASGTTQSSEPGLFYKTRLCNAFLEGRCTRGAACTYAHTETERTAYATGVPRRDIRATQDLRMAAKKEAQGGRRKSRSRSPVRARVEVADRHLPAASKPLPYIPPPRSSTTTTRKDRIDENEL